MRGAGEAVTQTTSVMCRYRRFTLDAKARRLAISSLALTAVFSAPSQAAGDVGTTPARALDGCYVPESGYAESTSYSETDQLGTYRLVLSRTGWAQLSPSNQSRVQRRLVLQGPLKGTVTSSDPSSGNTYLSHVLGTQERLGLVLSQGDEFRPTAVSPCETGGLVLQGTETIRPVAGTGAYARLLPGGSVVVKGTVNTCTFLNDFEVVPRQGQLCFPSTVR